MMATDHIINATEADFEYQVIAYSQQIPVIVDFWAEWCIPCRTMDPLLERLANESGGTFRLAKVNVDQNPNLALRYNIRTIPAVKAFRDGRVVSEFVNVLPETKLRDFIHAIAPSKIDLLIEKGSSLLVLEQWKSAENAFREALKEFPNQPAAYIGLTRSLIPQGQVHEALQLLQTFPASREYSQAEMIRPLAQCLVRIKDGPGYSDDELEAAYFNSLRLIMRGNFPAAMDGLLDVLRQNKRFRNGEVRQVMLGLFEVLGENHPLTRQYRQELASVLF
jgi:putative thioredoxin